MLVFMNRDYYVEHQLTVPINYDVTSFAFVSCNLSSELYLQSKVREKGGEITNLIFQVWDYDFRYSEIHLRWTQLGLNILTN